LSTDEPRFSRDFKPCGGCRPGSFTDTVAGLDVVMLKVSAAFRPQAAALDLEWLDRMLSHFSRDAVRGDLGAGRVCLKICERKTPYLAITHGASKLRRGIFLARSGMAKHDGGYI
jgi:hypothetical protein